MYECNASIGDKDSRQPGKAKYVCDGEVSAGRRCIETRKGSFAVNEEQGEREADRDKHTKHHVEPSTAHLQATCFEKHPSCCGKSQEEDINSN